MNKSDMYERALKRNDYNDPTMFVHMCCSERHIYANTRTRHLADFAFPFYPANPCDCGCHVS